MVTLKLRQQGYLMESPRMMVITNLSLEAVRPFNEMVNVKKP